MDEINIDRLSDFIEQNLQFSSNKEEYKSAAYTLKTSTDKKLITEAFKKLSNVTRELGKNIVISGLSQMVVETIKEYLKNRN